MKLNFIRLQTAVALVNVDIARKGGVIRVITLRIVGSNCDRQAVSITLHQRAIVARDAQHTLRGEIGS
ncbi:hypothetical protein D3C78_787390 [compost metagenome]